MSVNTNLYLTALSGLEQLIARYDDLVDASVRNKLRQEGFCGSAEAKAHLQSLQQEGRSLKIGVIGRVKAGKSSLINALLFDGKEVLPKAATPMTAALTSIGYAEKFTAEVHFFSPDDVAQLQSKAQEYTREISRLIQSYKDDYEQRKQLNPTRPLPPLEEDRLRAKASREVGEDGVLASAADLCRRMASSGIDVRELGSSRILTAESAEDLNKELMDYVGSSGKYMPFTRELILGMRVEALKGIEVIDTPGVNDPVKSREQRTYERLKECNAAFIVSPAGQFLSQQDFELADRLSAREGTQEIYIVASQVDTQLHSSIRKDANGVLPDAVSLLQKTLSEQAQSALNGVDNEVLRKIKNELSSRLIVTSGICETLLLCAGNSSDSTAAHAMKLLKQNYADYFSQPEDIEANLRLLSSRANLQRAVDQVRGKKEEILKQQVQNFVEAQWATLQQVKENVLTVLEERRQEIESGDVAQIEERIRQLNEDSTKGIRAVNTEFLNQAEEMRLKLPKELERVIQHAVDMVDEKSEGASGEVTEHYRVELDGLLNWIARKGWGGGSEERTRAVATLKPVPIRRALDGLGRLMRNGMKDCAAQSLARWRTDLTSGISRQLREAIGDDSVDINRLQSVCREVVSKMVDLPAVEVPELPAELAKSVLLKGNDVAEYLEAAQHHATSLEKCGYGFIQTVRLTVDRVVQRKPGEELFSDLVKEIEDLQSKVENKALTLEKMARMDKELREL